MKKCYYYSEGKRLAGWCSSNQPIFVHIARCNATREQEECSCGGDRTKCSFYPKVREEVNEEQKGVITNADKIRSMSDEELADFFYGSPEEEFGICYYCANFGGAGSPEPCKTQHGFCAVEDKNEAFKKWLKQPAKCEF